MDFLVPPLVVVLYVMGRVFLDAQLLKVCPSIPEMDTENTENSTRRRKTHDHWMYQRINLNQKLWEKHKVALQHLQQLVSN